MSTAPERIEIRLGTAELDDLRRRIAHARWPPASSSPSRGWEYGVDFEYLRELCDHWAGAYDPGRIERSLGRFENWSAGGLHFVHARPEDSEDGRGAGLPVLLLHGWPSAPIEFCEVIPKLTRAGHEVIVPSLPGFAFSGAAGAEAQSVRVVADRLRHLMGAELGFARYAVQGGDWGSIIAARMAFDEPSAIAGIHLSTPGVLPAPADLGDPPLAADERAYVQEAMRWRDREGYHLLVQGSAPDALAPGLTDSPIGLAAWLVDKYRRWSDCGGELERRFSADQVCDFLTIPWCTGTIASSMRLYAGEARSRWRLGPGETIDVPSAVADLPAEIVRPPRAWVERTLTDLRRWSAFERGGHFAAFEEPDRFAADLSEFLYELA